MQYMNKYRITCLKCKKSDVVVIDDARHLIVDYEGKFKTPFKAFRWRTDMKWGVQCLCGNDTRLSKSEAGDFDKSVQGDPISVKKIADDLKRKEEVRFRMERV